MKVLIATMTCGEGHNAIARSIRDALGEKPEVKIVDIYAGARQNRDNAFYLFAVHYIPHLYDFFWNIGRRFPAGKRYRGLAMQGIRSAASFMEGEVEAFRPDVVVCTHNQASNVFCWLKIHNRFHAPLYSVFFDYVNCPWWEGSVLCDGIFTPNAIVHPCLTERGFHEEQLIPTGFPINPRFDAAYDRTAIRQTLGTDDDTFVALTINGGAGIGNTLGLVKWLYRAKIEKKFLLLAVCGRNERAKKKLTKYCARHNIQNIRIYGFVNNVPELMCASDLYFCRGGGGAVSEAMASGLNFVVREGVTAQERWNKKILTARGLCRGMKRVSDARRILEDCVAHPEKEEAMRGRVREFVVKGGVANIASYLEEHFE